MDAITGDRGEVADAKPLTDHGLKTELFDDLDLFHGVKVRYDHVIDWSWKEDAPDALLPKDQFSIRWSGWLKAPGAGQYFIGLKSDQFCRFWLDGKLVYDAWKSSPQRPLEDALQLDLTERPHEIRIDYKHIDGAAFIQLFWWQTGVFEKQPIPAEALYSAPPP